MAGLVSSEGKSILALARQENRHRTAALVSTGTLQADMACQMSCPPHESLHSAAAGSPPPLSQCLSQGARNPLNVSNG